MSDIEDWVQAAEAPDMVHRSRRTIYRWIREGKVRTIRPMRALWLNVTDLRRQERDTRGRGLR